MGDDMTSSSDDFDWCTLDVSVARTPEPEGQGEPGQGEPVEILASRVHEALERVEHLHQAWQKAKRYGASREESELHCSFRGALDTAKALQARFKAAAERYSGRAALVLPPRPAEE